MALVLLDRVKETTTTTGLGSYTLAGAVSGFQSFSAIGNGNTTYYCVTNGTDWEVGIGTYTSSGTTLSRDSILDSSNAASAINWGAGTKDVFVTYPAGRSIAGSDSALAIPDPGTSGNVLTSDGTSWTSAVPSGGGASTITMNLKNAAYTVVAGDLGTIINCFGGSFTVSLTSSTILGSGFNCWIWNTGTGAITIDPDLSETIDGRSTLILRKGEGTQVVCDGVNWQTGDKKTMRGFSQNISAGASNAATGAEATAIGYSSAATGAYSVAIGSYSAAATGIYSIALGSSTTASGNYATAIGQNSASLGSVATSGSAATALGGSYASGGDSFAVAVANNTSSYGARGSNSIALGFSAAVSGSNCSMAFGRSSLASGPSSFALGNRSLASGTNSIVLCADNGGFGSSATATNAIALGNLTLADIIGKFALNNGTRFSVSGDSQTGIFILRCLTTGATATVLTTDNTAPGNDDQVILPNNSAFAFTGTVAARQQASGGTASAAWKIEGLIRREANAASTTLVASTVTAIDNTPGWTLALSADTTNGGLKVEATGAAATNIRWVATVQTSEVIYA